MKINAIDIRVGNILEYNNRLWAVLKTMHTQPGKGGAFMQVEMKDVRDGTRNNIRFRSSESVTKAQLDQRQFQYLYDEGASIALMDKETYEQKSLNKDMVGNMMPFLQEGMDIALETYNDEPISLVMPETMVMEVAETEPVVKGQTAASSYKPAVLENKVRVMVPPFIAIGDKVVIRLDPLEYLERAK
jgi:elongation factor P